MSTDDLIESFLRIPNDLRWADFCTVLKTFGYALRKKGGGGSHMCFVEKDSGKKIMLPKPHGSGAVKVCYIKRTVQSLQEEGKL